MDTSTMVLFVDTASTILLFNVVSFIAWELSPNLYFNENQNNKKYLIQTIMDEVGNARIDLNSLLAMRIEEPNLLKESMSPVTVLVPSGQVEMLANFSLSEINAISQIQVRVSNENVDHVIDKLLNLNSNLLKYSQKISFVVEGVTDVEITFPQLIQLKQFGGFEKSTSGGGNFNLTIQSLSKISAEELSTVASSVSDLNIDPPSLMSIEVGFSIHKSLQEIRKLPSMHKSIIQLDLAEGVKPFVTESDLSFLQNNKNIILSFLDSGEDLILKLPNIRVLKSNLLSVDKLLMFSKLGVNKINVDNISENSFLDISVPNFSLLKHLGILVENVPLHVQVNNSDDFRRLENLPIEKNSEKFLIYINDFSSLELNSMYKLVFSGMSLFDKKTLSQNTLMLTDDDIKKIDLNPSEWLHLLAKCGINNLNFLSPEILSQNFTEALLYENLSKLNQAEGEDALFAGIVLNDRNLASGRVDANFLNKNFDQIETLLEAVNLDRLYIGSTTAAEANLNLDVSLQVFTNWAQHGYLDFGGASVNIPEAWLDSLSHQNTTPQFLENHLNIKIVGVSLDEIVHLHFS